MSIVLNYIIPFIIILGLLIFFHELGHFLVAKFFGVKVLKFSLGFGPKLIGKQIGDTEYLISVFPLGGYVKMLGEYGEEDEEEDEPEPLTPEEEKRSFSNQPVFKRIAIVAAGPVFNLFLAFFILCGLYWISGKDVIAPKIGQVTPGTPADRAGFLKGDTIISIDGHPIESWSGIKAMVKDKAGTPLEITVKRDGRHITIQVTPEEVVVKNEFGEDIKSSLIGVVVSGDLAKLKLGPWESAREGFNDTLRWIELTCMVVVKLFQGTIPFKTVGGPIMIGQMTGQVAQQGLINLFPFTAIISVNLGILNLFPIPVLDGGVIIFLLIELMIGRPLSLRKRELAQKIGVALLVLLMIAVTYNDIFRLFTQGTLFGSGP
ncbi:MAG: RIP metalloprotease RseP [Desulfatiglans sp.]|jgi:regulator of sigma E protease|nr:RIP metalloprotease RseP [Thermodesulfobacteriota bacterium]MEE4351260.1 RIP metalloprotease RseP [Desulfatiglans sp.]